MIPTVIQAHLGNSALLNLPLTAFLCSRNVPPEAVLRCYDWAIAQREAGNCIISGFHSPLEKNVLRYLLKGKQPVILALARGLKQSWEPALQKALDDKRLLIISPFTEKTRRASSDTAAVRNDLMIQLASRVVVGYANPDGILARRLRMVEGEEVLFLNG
jgi:predicted Rossmann fold nucleotide-binding protein DprA/Smf involved in DNA uptake